MVEQGDGFVKNDADASTSRRGDGDRKTSKTVLPVNTAMLHKLTHSSLGLVLQRHKYSSVTIVAFVSDYTESQNKAEFRLKDPFGQSIEVQQWKGVEEDGSQTSRSGPPIRNDMLVRAFGHPRKTANSAGPLLLASRILPVTDVNELAMHVLDVLAAHVTLKKRKENVTSGLPAVTGFPGSQATASDSFNNTFTNTSIHQSAAGAAGPGSAANSQPSVTLSPKDLVLKSISKDNSVTGISLTELEAGLKSLNLKTIREAIDFLLNEGHIYTTTDDMHFKSLDG